MGLTDCMCPHYSIRCAFLILAMLVLILFIAIHSFLVMVSHRTDGRANIDAGYKRVTRYDHTHITITR